MPNIPAQYLVWGALVIAIIAVLALIISLIAVLSSSRLHRRFRRWKQLQKTADLDEVFAQTVDQVAQLRTELAKIQAELATVRETLATKVSTARILRYNAFADTGSDLSFSIALLDDNLDGVVISSIYGRDESRTYAKPVEGGTSRYVLTDEERTVIEAVRDSAPVQAAPAKARN
jgi:hypothetical protein